MNRDELLDKLRIQREVLAAARAERDRLIREHPGTLREIAEATGLTHQGVAYIKNKEEK